MFELDGREVTESGVQAVRIVPALDKLEHPEARLDLRAEPMTIEQLALSFPTSMTHL